MLTKNGEQLSRLIKYGCSTRSWFQRLKQYHKGKFAGFSFGVDQWETLFFEELNQQKTYEKPLVYYTSSSDYVLMAKL